MFENACMRRAKDLSQQAGQADVLIGISARNEARASSRPIPKLAVPVNHVCV